MTDESKPCERCCGTGIEPWIPLASHFVHVEVVSEANRHDRTCEQVSRKLDQKRVIDAHLWQYGGRRGGRAFVTMHGRVHVVMTRHGKKPFDDDNLARALKTARDCVARWLDVDDGDTSRVTWQNKQKTGEKMQGITITICRRHPCVPISS